MFKEMYEQSYIQASFLSNIAIKYTLLKLNFKLLNQYFQV